MRVWSASTWRQGGGIGVGRNRAGFGSRSMAAATYASGVVVACPSRTPSATFCAQSALTVWRGRAFIVLMVISIRLSGPPLAVAPARQRGAPALRGVWLGRKDREGGPP